MSDVTDQPASERKWWRQPFQQNVLLKAATILFEGGVVVFMLWLATKHKMPAQALGGGMAFLAIMNFVIFYQSDYDADPRESRGAAMRRAIAASSILTYFIFLSLVLFSPTLQQVTSGQSELKDCLVSTSDADGNESVVNACATIAGDLLGKMTWLVTTIVGFYFVTSGAEDYVTKKAVLAGGTPAAGGAPPDPADEALAAPAEAPGPAEPPP